MDSLSSLVLNLCILSTQLKSSLLTEGSRMAKRIQYIKTNQMIKVDEIRKQ